MIISRPSSPDRLRLVRASAARRMASGSCTRMSVSWAYRSRLVRPVTSGATTAPLARSDMFDLSQKCLDLVGRRHGGGAFPAGGDDRAGGVAEPQDGFQVPAGEQAVADGAAETIACAQSVDHRHRGRRYLDDAVPGHPEDALRALLDDRQLDTGVQQGLSGPHGVGFADGDLAFLLVAARDRH